LFTFLDIIKSSSTTDLPEPAYNEFTQRIKTANDSQELLEIMTITNKKDIEPHQLSFALRRLFTLQKNGYNTIPPRQLAKHSGFNNIEHLLKFKASRMEVNDCVSCLKIFTYFGLKSDNITVQRLLYQVKDQINDLSPNNIVFLNFLLSKMNQTPLIEALQIALPVVFNLNLSQKMDHNNTKELTDLLFYATSSTLKVSSKSMTNIITALTLHGESLELDEARSIVWSFSSMENYEPGFERLFDNSMRVINSRIMEITFEHIETTVSKLSQKLQRGDYFVYNEQFLNNCARYVVEKDVGYLNASYILKKFNKINFVNYDLLNYIDKTIVNNHANLSSCKAAGLLTLSSAFSNACYKSENWEILKSLIHENPMMHSQNMKLPWIKLAVELMSVDFHSNILLEKVFSTKFLEEYIRRDDKVLDQLQLLSLYQSAKLLIPDYDGPFPEQRFIDEAISATSMRVNEPFLKILANIFGGTEFIQTNLITSHGHCLDFVVSFDNFEAPIAMPCRVFSYDELPKSQINSVAVFFNSRVHYPLNYPEKLRGTFDLKRRTIEALGIKVCNISKAVWNNLPESEKESYLEREIRFAIR
jgi:FAST kinase domain-containing protein 2